MRVIVTGSRHYSDATTVTVALNLALAATATFIAGNILTVMHGVCPRGADAMARQWVRSQRTRLAREEPHYADWRAHGSIAGPLRNQAMVDAGADLCMAFFEPGLACRGTHDCVRRAEKAGIPILRLGASPELSTP